MPARPGPDELTARVPATAAPDGPSRAGALELRACPLDDDADPASSATWIRVAGRLPDDPLLHRALLVYLSDLTVVHGAFRRQGLSRRDIRTASLDHALWLFRAARVDEWVLYDSRSPSAAGGRAAGQGRLFSAVRAVAGLGRAGDVGAGQALGDPAGLGRPGRGRRLVGRGVDPLRFFRAPATATTTTTAASSATSARRARPARSSTASGTQRRHRPRPHRRDPLVHAAQHDPGPQHRQRDPADRDPHRGRGERGVGVQHQVLQADAGGRDAQRQRQVPVDVEVVALVDLFFLAALLGAFAAAPPRRSPRRRRSRSTTARPRRRRRPRPPSPTGRPTWRRARR